MIKTHTITYTDGVADEVIFNDKVHIAEYGSNTPLFSGNLDREGYTFIGWNPSVSILVTQDVTYVAQWQKDEPVLEEYTVIYNDGVDTDTIFGDQIYTVSKGTQTPKFKGEPKREGFIFKGWNPEVKETVTDNITYRALWEKPTTPTDPVLPQTGIGNHNPSLSLLIVGLTLILGSKVKFKKRK